MGDQTRKNTIQCNGLAANVHDAPGQPQEQPNHDQHTHQTKLFANNGQQKVGVGLWQPVQLLHAATQPYAKDLAAPDSDQRVGQLVPLAQCMLLGPGVQIGKDALTAPITQGNHESEGHDQNGSDQEEHAGIHATQE